MKRIIIICEGHTEAEFCKDVLYPYFLTKDIFIFTPLIKKSGGGIVPWRYLKGQIEIHLAQDREAIVTTLIDYYGIHDRHEFPEWEAAHRIADKNLRMEHLEKAMNTSVNSPINNFIPYIQLHEFEALLFNNIDIFEAQIANEEFIDKSELIATLNSNPNPELINDTPNNAPSYRLKRIIKGFNKIVYGAILADSIGLTGMRDKCPRFNAWISKLENI